MQKNWIGKSLGCEIDFAIEGNLPIKNLKCFTKQKNKVEIIFPIYKSNVELDLKYEKLKSNQICIELKDNIQLWKFIEIKLK